MTCCLCSLIPNFYNFRLFLSDSDRFFGLSGSWYGSVFIYNQMGAPMWITQAIYIFVMVYSVVYITTRQQYYTFLEIPITLGGITLMYVCVCVRNICVCACVCDISY